MHPLKVCDIALVLLWTVVGVIAMFGEISKWTFLCLLICYLTEVVLKILKDDYDNHDDDGRPFAA